MRPLTALATAFLSLSLTGSPLSAIAATPGTSPFNLQMVPGSSLLLLDSTFSGGTARQATTPVHIYVTGPTAIPAHSVYIYACLNTDEALRHSTRTSTIPSTNLHVMNDQGVWAELEPLPELQGRRGVRIATINTSSTTILLQVQLQLSTRQVSGKYQGVLTLVAQEQQ